MITRVEATNFRCLVLVGPNSSAKSAFLDVIGFIGDLVSLGLKGALAERTDNFYDLVWGREGASFSHQPSVTRFASTVHDDRGNTRSTMQRGLAAAAFTEDTGHNRHFFPVIADRSGLWNLPDDQAKFHVGAWFRELLQEGAQLVDLNKGSLRAAPPLAGVSRAFTTGGTWRRRP